MKLCSVRHAWPEGKGFFIDRPFGHEQYTFLHFFQSIEIKINEKIIVTQPHSCIIFSPKFPQYFTAHSPILHDWFHFETDDSDLFNKLDIPLNILMYPSSNGFITNIVKEMELELVSERAYNTKITDIKMNELFIKLSRDIHGDVSYSISTETEDIFHRVRCEFLSTISKPWTVDEMAKKANLSPSRFYTIYKSIYGTTPINDLISARIEYAKNALHYTNKSISEISVLLGYNNITHFMRQFKSFTGITPGMYREHYSTVCQ